MAEDTSKRKLIRFLSRRAWDPVLKASPKKYSEADQKLLDRLQKKTQSQKERYHGYKNAGQVRQEFQDDLSSQQARKTQANLRKLNLPVQPDIADEFFQLADKLGITPERQQRRHHKPHPPHPWHKSKPEQREKAKRALKKMAREGNKAAIETLRKAPRQWAHEYAEAVTKKSAKSERSGAPTAKRKTTAKKAAKKTSGSGKRSTSR